MKSSPSGAVIAVLFSWWCVASLAPRLLATQAPPASLDALTHKSGWVPLGHLWADLHDGWAVASDPTFDIVGRPVDSSAAVVLPVEGDRIRLRVSLPVIILGFRDSGDERHLDPPLLTDSLESSDETGLRLEPGTVLDVHEVSISRAYGQGRFVHARVSLSAAPAPDAGSNGSQMKSSVASIRKTNDTKVTLRGSIADA